MLFRGECLGRQKGAFGKGQYFSNFQDVVFVDAVYGCEIISLNAIFEGDAGERVTRDNGHRAFGGGGGWMGFRGDLTL